MYPSKERIGKTSKGLLPLPGPPTSREPPLHHTEQRRKVARGRDKGKLEKHKNRRKPAPGDGRANWSKSEPMPLQRKQDK